MVTNSVEIMRDMLKILMTITTLLLLAAGGNAQSFEIKMSSDSLLVGNYFKVSFISKNSDGKFEAPEFEGMQVLSGPNVSSSVSIVNGDKSSTVSYSYLLQPEDVGIYTIPPAYLVSEDKTIETTPTVINVHPNPEGIITRPEQEQFGSFFQMEEAFPFGLRERPKPPTPPATPKRKYKKL